MCVRPRSRRRSGIDVDQFAGMFALVAANRRGGFERLGAGEAEAPDHFFSCGTASRKVCILMRPVLVLQQGLRTPTGPVSAKFSIGGIRGLAWTFMSMRRS